MDPLIAAAGKLIAPTFVKSFLDKSEGIFKILSSEVKQAFNDGLSSYLSKHELNYSYVKTILHRHEPVPFYDLYFPVKLERIKSDYHGKRDEIETVSVSRIFLQTNFITVIGNAGSGKSTLTKHVFLNSMNEGMGIPILVELRNLVYHSGSFFDYLKSIIFTNELAKSESIFERLLSAGKFIFLIDGFDEVKRESQNNILVQLNTFVDKYKYNRFMLTSRPGVNLEMFPSFYNYKMKNLEGEEIYEFINRQKLSKVASESVINYLKQNNSNYLFSYLSNPLLLTLYLVTYTSNSSIPDKRSSFYRRVFEVLLREHDTATKIGYERSLLTKLSQERIEDILKMFSFITFFENYFTFDREYLIKKLSETKRKLKTKYSSFPDFEIEHLIYDLKVAVGVWIQDESYVYFIHRSMQEYFAAIFISDINVNKKAVYERIIEKIDYSKELADDNVFGNSAGYTITNFLSLCQEVDEFSFYQYVKIPVLKQLVDSLNVDDERQKISLLFKASGLDFFFSKDEYDNFKLISISYTNNKYQIIDEIKNLFHKIKFFDYDYKIDKKRNTLNSFRTSFYEKIEEMDWLPIDLYRLIVEECDEVVRNLNHTVTNLEARISDITESDSTLSDLI